MPLKDHPRFPPLPSLAEDRNPGHSDRGAERGADSLPLPYLLPPEVERFSEDALVAILFEQGRGIPALIGSLAGHCLQASLAPGKTNRRDGLRHPRTPGDGIRRNKPLPMSSPQCGSWLPGRLPAISPPPGRLPALNGQHRPLPGSPRHPVPPGLHPL